MTRCITEKISEKKLWKLFLIDKKQALENKKPDIEVEKPDIGTEKPDIETLLKSEKENFSQKTRFHIIHLYESYGNSLIFGRKQVQEVTGLQASRASELIKLLLDNKLIKTVKGYGKGKYMFEN